MLVRADHLGIDALHPWKRIRERHKDLTATSLSERLHLKCDPCWSMIAGVVFAADPTINAGVNQSSGQLRREKQMIESHPLIRLPSVEFVVPECPYRPCRMQLSQSIRPPLRKQPLECFTAGWLHKSVLVQRSGGVNILRSRYHVVIASQHDRDTSCDQVVRMCDQPFEPRQFIREFRTGLRIAVG